jgi:hypothetical protein
MARGQSPGYPSASLRKSLEMVKKVFDADRRNPIDREVAAKHIGYSSLSGASEKALASMAHYDLVEKTGKGELRVTQLAVDALYPDNPEDRISALRVAGTSPQIFKDLKARFPDGVSEEALKSYLLRENFLDRAINPVTTAYLDTCRFLEQEKVFESGGIDSEEGPESPTSENDKGEKMETVVANNPPQVAPPIVAVDDGESEWMRNPLGRGKAVRVLVTGEMGGKEIGKLIKLLEAQKAILDDDEEDEDKPRFTAI